MIPDPKSSDRVTGAMLSIPYNEQYMKNKNMYLSQQIITTGLIGNISLINKISLSEKTIEIPEVLITATRKIEYINQYEEVYKYANMKSLSHEQLLSANSIAVAIRRLVNPYLMEDVDAFHPGAAIYLHPRHSFFGANIKVMFVLDGMPLHVDNAWQRINDLNPEQIASISVLEGDQGHVIYGEEAIGGVVFVNTYYPGLSKIRTDWKTQDKNNNMLVPIKLFRPNIEFYNPTRSEIDNDPALKGRATVYWNPEVYFDGKKPVQIKYINPLRSARMIITINCVSLNNLLGTVKTGYWVHEIK
jgi:hypothetical protein